MTMFTHVYYIGSSGKMLNSNQIGGVFLVPLALCFLLFLPMGMRGSVTPAAAGYACCVGETWCFITKNI